MNKVPSAVAGTLAGGVLIFGGLEVIAASGEASSNVEQVNACAKHLGNYAIGVVSEPVAKQEAQTLKMDCERFVTTWPPISLNRTKEGAKTLVLALPDLASFLDIQTPPAKAADGRKEEVKIAGVIVTGVGATLGGIAVSMALNDSNLGFRRRRRAGDSKMA